VTWALAKRPDKNLCRPDQRTGCDTEILPPQNAQKLKRN